MKALTLVLGAAVVALSITCFRLYHQLGDEREKDRAETAQPAVVAARPLAANPATSPPPPPPPASLLAPRDETQKARDAKADYRALRLKILRDPSRRDLARAEQIESLRAQSAEMQADLGLTDEQYEQLLYLVAEQELRRNELYLGGTELTKDLSLEMSRARENEAREIDVLLGPGKAQEYEAYIRSLPIRIEVQQFRSRLREAIALTDDQSTRLVAELMQTRTRLLAEQQERYAGLQITMTSEIGDGGRFVASEAAGVPMEQQIVEQVEAYYAEMARSAGRVLDAAQLAEFEKAQKLHIVRHRSQLQQQVLMQNRLAAGSKP